MEKVVCEALNMGRWEAGREKGGVLQLGNFCKEAAREVKLQRDEKVVPSVPGKLGPPRRDSSEHHDPKSQLGKFGNT